HRRPDAPGPWAWLRTRYAEPATWRALGYLALLATLVPAAYGMLALVLFLIAVLLASPALVGAGEPITLGFRTVDSVGQTVPYLITGLVLLPAVPYLVAVLAGGHAALARALLGGGPDDRLRAELVQVSRSRSRLVDAFEVERRRIERDLHDIAQQRLVALTLQLGLARLDLPPDSPAGRAVGDAHERAKELMTELRQLIHNIHPRVLTDLGLAAALHDLAERSPLPVTVHADLAARLPAPVESTAYFVVAEALTNVAKHSGATGARVTAYRRDGRLV
ncbi:sensor histidine kinase, partial [Micromonospora zhanjiangensis]